MILTLWVPLSASAIGFRCSLGEPTNRQISNGRTWPCTGHWSAN